jgi:rhodanese-related sulfurtransferase
MNVTQSSTVVASTEISPSDLHSRLASGDPVQLIDVRDSAEFEAQHIRGSKLMPLGDLSNRLGELDRGHPIVTVCRTGRRSEEARKILASAGYQGVVSLTGGVTGWEAAGYVLTKNPGAIWSMDRQVRCAAGALVLLGLILSFVIPGAVALSWIVGAGLVLSAVTDTCAMAQVFGMLPWNRKPKQL